MLRQLVCMMMRYSCNVAMPFRTLSAPLSAATTRVSPAAAQAAAAAATAVAEQIARGLIFLIGFLLVLVAWSLLSHALDLVAKLPVLSSLNGTLGGILGFAKGVLVLYIAVWVLCDLTGFISPDTVAQTKLLLFLTQHSILDLFLVGQSFASQNA